MSSQSRKALIWTTIFLGTARALWSGALSGHVKRALPDLAAEYDYIVVGGGTSGLVLANRLTEDPNSKTKVSRDYIILLTKSQPPF